MKVLIYDLEDKKYISAMYDGRFNWTSSRRLAFLVSFEQGMTWIKSLNTKQMNERYTLIGHE
jgi:hypothetical protein